MQYRVERRKRLLVDYWSRSIIGNPTRPGIQWSDGPQPFYRIGLMREGAWWMHEVLKPETRTMHVSLAIGNPGIPNALLASSSFLFFSIFLFDLVLSTSPDFNSSFSFLGERFGAGGRRRSGVSWPACRTGTLAHKDTKTRRRTATCDIRNLYQVYIILFFLLSTMGLC